MFPCWLQINNNNNKKKKCLCKLIPDSLDYNVSRILLFFQKTNKFLFFFSGPHIREALRSGPLTWRGRQCGLAFPVPEFWLVSPGPADMDLAEPRGPGLLASGSGEGQSVREGSTSHKCSCCRSQNIRGPWPHTRGLGEGQSIREIDEGHDLTHLAQVRVIDYTRVRAQTHVSVEGLRIPEGHVVHEV